MVCILTHFMLLRQDTCSYFIHYRDSFPIVLETGEFEMRVPSSGKLLLAHFCVPQGRRAEIWREQRLSQESFRNGSMFVQGEPL